VKEKKSESEKWKLRKFVVGGGVGKGEILIPYCLINFMFYYYQTLLEKGKNKRG